MVRRVVLLILPVALLLLALYVDGYSDAGPGRGAFVALADGRTGADATVVYAKSTPQASEGTVADVVLSLSAEGQPDSCTGKLSSSANGEYYLCVTVLNSGDVTLTEHILETHKQDDSVLLESELAPGDTMTVTAELLEGLGLESILGPFELPEEADEPVVASVSYEGSGLAKTGDDATTTLTAKASVSITVLAGTALGGTALAGDDDDASSADALLPTVTPYAEANREANPNDYAVPHVDAGFAACHAGVAPSGADCDCRRRFAIGYAACAIRAGR